MSHCAVCCKLANINTPGIYAFPRRVTSKLRPAENWRYCREKRQFVCMTLHTCQTNLWCVSASEPLRPLSLVTRWDTYTHTRENVLTRSSWDFCLSTQYQVTLFSCFFLIKSQQGCYLTLIRSKLNPCLNLRRCATHFNWTQSHSVQPKSGWSDQLGEY